MSQTREQPWRDDEVPRGRIVALSDNPISRAVAVIGETAGHQVMVIGEDDDDTDEPAEEFEPMRAELPNQGRELASDPGLIDLAKPANVGKEAPHIRAKGLEKPKQPQNLSYSAPSEQGDVEVAGRTASNADDEFSDVGRNQLCPCGSGKKYKRCHGAPGGPTGLTARIS
jgi:preprotein translocase subunit SecA